MSLFCDKASTRRRLIRIMVIAQAAGTASTALAGSAIFPWDGQGKAANPTSWGDRDNWVGHTVPSPGENVSFGTGFGSGLNITVAGGALVQSFTVDTSSAFNLMPDPANPSKPLELVLGDIIRTGASTSTQTISAPVKQDVNDAWSIAGSGTLVVSGVVSGAAIGKVGTGTLSLTGSNTYSSMSLAQGTLVVPINESLGASGATFSIGTATLHTETTIGLDRPIQLLGAATFDSLGTVYLEGGVSGTGTIIKNGTGRMRLFAPIAGPLAGGSNTYIGNVINLQGQLLTNPAGLRGDVTNQAELQFSQTSSGTYTSNLSGGGTLIIGGGSIALNGSNSMTGGMFINDSDVSIGADTNLGASTATVTLNNDATVLRLTSSITSSRPLTIGAGVSPTIRQDIGTSTFSGAITGSGTLIKAGAGMLRVTNVRINALTVNGGTVANIAGGGTLGTTSVQTLSFGGTLAAPVGALDLNDHSLAIDYSGTSPLDTVRQQIKSGFAGGSWNGAGLTSSSAATSTTHKTALGFAEASAAGFSGTFDGVPIDSSTVVVRYTFAGDADLNKTVGTPDFTRLASHFNQTGATWFNGDFNYDGTVNALDFNALAANFGQTLSAPALGTLVPEPTALLAMALTIPAVGRRSHTNRLRARGQATPAP